MATMKALRFHPPGAFEQLKVEDVPLPTPTASEILIKVKAASVMWQEPYWPIYQKPDGTYEPHILCHDFSGTIEKLGPECQSVGLKVGAQVFAFDTKRRNDGGAAEYALVNEDSVALIPNTMTLLEAGSVPLAALTAWQALFEHSNVKSGDKVLITAAAGATGLWAVQMAKKAGAHVVATASSERSFEILTQLGVDRIINYKSQILEHEASDFDYVLDCVGGNVLQQCVKALREGGQIISIVDYNVHELVPEGVSAKFFIVSTNLEQLCHISKLIENGELKTFIDSSWALDKGLDAFKHASGGHAHGRVLITP